MTNLERIRKIPVEELAELLIHNEPEMEYDEGMDGELDVLGQSDRYISPCSSLAFWSYEDCLEETIAWLLEESEDE